MTGDGGRLAGNVVQTDALRDNGEEWEGLLDRRRSLGPSIRMGMKLPSGVKQPSVTSRWR